MKLNIKKNCAYIIAEIGNNHEGSFVMAKKLIQKASKTGVNAVKFQTFKTNDFISNKGKKKILKKFEISYENFEKLKKISHSFDLNFISTPLDIESAKFLGKISDAIKISSGDNNFLELIDLCLNYNKQIIISLGLLNHIQTNKNIKEIIKLFSSKAALKKISFLHCVSSYPVEYDAANLKRIVELKKNWPNLRFGYSDHTLGIEACLAASVLGAEIIEKHFTLNKNFSNFRDHALSADVNEMKMIVSGVRKVEKMTSKYSRFLSNDETRNQKIIRRHPFAVREINTGEILNLNNIKFLRPEKPMTPVDLNLFIGKKSKKQIPANNLITKSDII
jgi:sialic acid synthase SpsE